jgi:hypothetical protein
MTMNKDLMLAVLSMDAYIPLGTIGNATVISSAPQSNGFAAVAYRYNGQTIISYRGTDGYYLGDAWYGWGGGIVGAETTQAGLAAKFYQDVAGTDGNIGTTFPYSTLGSVVFTGHSLGGGLAGLMAGLYGQEAVVFDNMAYTAAINKTYHDATTPTYLVTAGEEQHLEINPDYQPILNTFYNGQAPLPTTTSHISGFQESGQVLSLQSTGPVVGAGIDWGFGAISRHSISLLVLNMYAEQLVSNAAWKDIAHVFGPMLFAMGADTSIAYSVVSEGARPNGDAAANDNANPLPISVYCCNNSGLSVA